MTWSWPLFWWFTIGGLIGFVMGVAGARMNAMDTCQHIDRIDVVLAELRLVVRQLKALKDGVTLH